MSDALHGGFVVKRFFVVVLVIVTMFSLVAGEAEPVDGGSVLFKDIGIRVGNGSFLWDSYMDTGLHFLGGVTFGLTKRLEVAVEAITPIVPSPLSDVVAGLEFSYALLGDRVSSGDTAGTGINTMLSLGLFCSNHNSKGVFMPTYLTFRLNTLTIGMPYSGRREHLLPIGIAWNFMEGKVSLFCSILMYDHYVKAR